MQKNKPKHPKSCKSRKHKLTLKNQKQTIKQKKRTKENQKKKQIRI